MWLLSPASVVPPVVVLVEEDVVVELDVVVSSSPVPPVGFCSVLEDSFDVLDSVVVDVVFREELLVVT